VLQLDINVLQLFMCPGGWPLVGIDLDMPWDMNDIQGYVSEQLYGSNAFFALQVLTDDKNSSRNIIFVGNMIYILLHNLHALIFNTFICLADTNLEQEGNPPSCQLALCNVSCVLHQWNEPTSCNHG